MRCLAVLSSGRVIMSSDSAFRHSDERSHARYQDACFILEMAFGLLGKPNTVVDVGGGQGAWCKALLELGVTDVRCIDSPTTRDRGLVIPERYFEACDLSKGFPDRRNTDWAMCLEVAEHLPESMSEELIRFLTDCSDVVLFSAAIPGQPGQRHINCQPPSYWRDKFRAHGYTRIDCLRPRLIGAEDLPYWWKQNLFVFAKDSALDIPTAWNTRLGDDVEIVSDRMLRIYRDALEASQTPRRASVKPMPLKRRLNQAISKLLGISKQGEREKETLR